MHYAALPLGRGEEYEIHNGRTTHMGATLKILVPEGFEIETVLGMIGHTTAEVILKRL